MSIACHSGKVNKREEITSVDGIAELHFIIQLWCHTECDKLLRQKNETCVTGRVRKHIAKGALNFDGSIYTLYMCKSAKLYWW